ncbi:hypothetical protein F4821DRAFT_223422 [Hypoxylon rubiginosum]|uniref:Uncharacterized protein n=1 Tax=Hypoxylon rubiginosum TaxID=110542 RepID=A0ACC0DJW0_9PEZI|nr:hypothetical protein F4821DRAFT_223422 [Hypoxylon rubiginosum]
MEAALSIPELLEAILLHLDMATLLVSATRVSKAWQTVINTSISIQRALYFEPIPTDAQSYDQKVFPKPCVYSASARETRYPIINPLLKKRFGHCFFDTGEFYGYIFRANSFYSMPWRPNSSRNSQAMTVDDLRPAFPGGPQTAEMTPKELDEIQIACEKFTRKGASWRKMLVSQPPPPHLGYLFMDEDFDSGHFYGPHWVWTTLVSPTAHSQSPGLRMGMLYDVVQYRAGHHEYTSMWFRVVWNQAREPYNTLSSQAKCRELLQQTNVVVEFYHVDDEVFRGHHYEPPDVAAFDQRFRSEDYQHIDIQAHEKTWNGSEMPWLDREFSVR